MITEEQNIEYQSQIVIQAIKWCSDFACTGHVDQGLVGLNML